MAYGMNNLTTKTRVSTEQGTGTVFDWDLHTGEVYVSMDDRSAGELCFPFSEVTVFAAAEYKREEPKMTLHKGNRVLTPAGMGTVEYVATMVTCTEVDVRLDDTKRVKTFFLDEVEHLDYQLDKDAVENYEVWQALNFIHQLRQRGDEPGNQMADLLEPLARAYTALKTGT